MFRPRSTDVWYNAPGVVAAYQPVTAPDSFAARQNVCNDGRMAGRYTAQPGVPPTHNPREGWTFTAASSQYLNTGLFVTALAWSAMVRYSNASSGTWPFGCDGPNTSGNQRWGILPYNSLVDTRFCNGGSRLSLPYTPQFGVLAFANRAYYRNGALWGQDIPTGSVPTVPVTIGALNRSGAPVAFFSGSIQAFVVSSVNLTPAHVAQYSLQIANCHVNPDWSAWGRRRQYYYAPSAVTAIAGSVGIYGRRGSVALPGGVRIEAVR